MSCIRQISDVLASFGCDCSAKAVKPLNEDKTSGVIRCAFVSAAYVLGMVALLVGLIACVACCPISTVAGIFSAVLGMALLTWSVSVTMRLLSSPEKSETVQI